MSSFATRLLSARKLFSICPTHRTHMNHGGGHARSTTLPGPREAAVPLGLQATQNTANVMRLLEASHVYRDAGVWHESALCWSFHEGEWQTSHHFTGAAVMAPRLHALHFSDHRTALVKITGSDGMVRYLSLLQLDEHTSVMDGWKIVRQVQVPATSSALAASLEQTLQLYLQIEHGGGAADYEHAQRLFAPQSSLVAVGMADHDDPWSAPAGTLLEIPLEVYLEGVKQQTPHDIAARKQDAIVSVDVCGPVASAVVRVGNGAQTLVFEDHLLLGQTSSGTWKILSKTFSPQAWPE